MTAGDSHQGLPFGGAEIALDEQVAMLEEITDFPLDPLLATGGTPRRLRAGTTARQLGSARRQGLPQLGHRGEHRLGDLAQNVECAKLMWYVAENRGDRCGVQRRAVGRDPLEGESARFQSGVEATKEGHDVGLGGVVVEDLVGQPLECPVIDDRQDAERPVIQLVGGDVTGEVRQRPVEIVGVDLSRRLFPPGLDPVLDRCVGDEHAVIAPESSNWRCDTVSHPR